MPSSWAIRARHALSHAYLPSLLKWTDIRQKKASEDLRDPRLPELSRAGIRRGCRAKNERPPVQDVSVSDQATEDRLKNRRRVNNPLRPIPIKANVKLEGSGWHWR